MKRKTVYLKLWYIIMAIMIVITACQKDDDDNGPQKYSIGGIVEGLTGSGLVIQNNNSDDLAITENGIFTFPTKLIDSSKYDVTIKSYPAGQTCYVVNGTGTVNEEDVTDIKVVCSTPANSCTSGSIVYEHKFAFDYAGFHEDITVSGTIPFLCDRVGKLSGSGSANISVEGTVTANCLIRKFSGSATMNVILSGTMSTSEVTIILNETWYVGSPTVSGTSTNTCTGDSQSYSYFLPEVKITESLEFPNVDGHRIQHQLIGASGSGYYSWTLYIN